MSSDQQHDQQAQQQLYQRCMEINQICKLEFQQEFSVEHLLSAEWYLQVFSVICQELKPKIQQLYETLGQQAEDHAKAIDYLLNFLVEQELIDQNRLNLKGQNMIEGDLQQIDMMILLIQRLLDDQPEDGDEHQQNHKEQEQNYQNDDFQEEQPNNKPIHQNQQILSKVQKSHPSPQNAFPSDPNSQSLRYNTQQKHQTRSVLAIKDQFADEDQGSQNYSRQSHEQPIKQNKNYPSMASNNVQNEQIPLYVNKYSSKNGYRESQEDIKSKKIIDNNGMIDLSSQNNHFVIQNNGNIFASGQSKYNKNQFSSDKPLQQTKLSKQEYKKVDSNQYFVPSKQQPHYFPSSSEQEDENEYFVGNSPSGLKKVKSDAKLKTMTSSSKKTTIKKNKLVKSSIKLQQHKPKLLVSHPTIKKKYRKASNPQARVLTTEVKSHASKILKKKHQSKQLSSNPLHQTLSNPTEQEMGRKRRQIKIKLKDRKKDFDIKHQKHTQSRYLNVKSQNQLAKILNWRSGQLKKQKQQYQEAMSLKLQVQKQNYIKKINNLILRLQKQKQIDERVQYKQKMVKQNKQAEKRITAIQQWYRDRLCLLREGKAQARDQQRLLHTGHKQILKAIEKQLKKQNDKKMDTLAKRYRRDQINIQNDLEQLEHEIIRVYKRN